MADVLVLGGGIAGSAVATMLARDGHDVVVLERDAEPPPRSVPEALSKWARPGVAQFRQVHYMHARFRHVLDEELPDVRDALMAEGGRVYDAAVALLPPTIDDPTPREGDDRYRTVTGRRPMLQTVFERTAENQAGVEIVRGVNVEGLLAGAGAADGVPHVAGVRTSTGEEFHADLVIDAMGRGSRMPQLLTEIGARPPYEEAERNGFMYYARYFHGDLPEQGGRGLIEFGSYSILTLPSDNDTWWVLLWGETGDRPLKALRDVETWTKLVRAIPTKAHWLDGEPITDIVAMSGILDRYRRYVVDGKPVATGMLAVGDAWACTNPSLGRGMSLALRHAQRLRHMLREVDGDPAATALEWDEITESDLTPWYRTQVDMDRTRVAAMAADREGREPPRRAAMVRAFQVAYNYDADCYRAFLEIMACLKTPMEIFADRAMFAKVAAASEGRSVPATGPDRAELLEILAS
jgi:2-polyprenyl-6-methoxyphenol hydroxylase-like FAD-dependent oxidoreductase